jgi:hypothetical protein
MAYSDQFPGFQLDVEIPEGFKDTSWRNDGCPSWANEAGVVLWIAEKDPELREFPESGRFTVQWPTDDDQWPTDDEMTCRDCGDVRSIVMHSSDDWQVILAIVKALS